MTGVDRRLDKGAGRLAALELFIYSASYVYLAKCVELVDVRHETRDMRDKRIVPFMAASCVSERTRSRK